PPEHARTADRRELRRHRRRDGRPDRRTNADVPRELGRAGVAKPSDLPPAKAAAQALSSVHPVGCTNSVWPVNQLICASEPDLCTPHARYRRGGREAAMTPRFETMNGTQK